MNESTVSKSGVSQNLQSTLDFLSSVNFEERISFTIQCCEERREHFFQDADVMYLLKTEIIENGFGPQYFPDDTECEIEARVNALQTRLQKEKAPIMLEKAELVAIILYTHEKSDLYVNLKTTMTGKGKKKDQRPKVKCLDFIGQSRSYAQWKEEYQKSEGK